MAAAELAGVTLPATSNWRASGKIPAMYFPIFADELARRGKAADRSVFGFKRLDEARA